MNDAGLSWFRLPTDTTAGTLNPVFELLERRVVAGGADEQVLVGTGGPVTFARLLEDVAALGGVLRAHGVVPGTPVAWSGPSDRDGATALLALARIGGRLDPDGELVIDRDGIHQAGLDPVSWELALRAGRTDPAPTAELHPEDPWHAGTRVRHLARALRDLPTPTTAEALVATLLATTIEA